MTAELGEGRYGPVFLGMDTATESPVVIRTFVVPMTPDARERFLDALTRLCESPLAHAAIASPLACGEVNDVPFLVHAFLPGQPLDEYLRQNGRRSLSEVSLRIMHLAGAIDFAAAAGVVHGSLGPRDLLLDDDRTGIAGFGIAQALYESGAEPREPSTADDLYALAAMAYEMLAGERYEGGGVRAGLDPVPLGDDVDREALSRTLDATLSSDPAGWPASALQFAALLHGALHDVSIADPATATADGAHTAVVSPEPDAGARAVAPPIVFELAPAEPPPPAPGPMGAARTPAEPGGEPSPTLPLFDPPMREPAPARYAVVAEPAPVDADLADIALRDDPVRGPRDARRPSSPDMFVPAASASSGSARPMHAGVVVIALLAATAVFLVLGGPRLFDASSGESPATSASLEEGGPSSDAGVRPDASAPPAPEAGAVPPASSGEVEQFAPPPVLSDGPIAERDVAAGAGPRTGDPFATGPAAPSAAPAAQSAPSTPAASAPSASRPSAPPVGSPAPVTGAPVTEAPASGGRVLVRSDPPGAQVLIGDVPRGQTPVAIRDLPFGTHTITVSAPGLPVWSQEVSLTAERPSQSFEIALGAPAARPAEPPPVPAGPATLHVESRPTGAQVWVDGRLVGTTPLQLSEVEEGAHAVRLELPGYRPWTTSVSVARGARARVAASLER